MRVDRRHEETVAERGEAAVHGAAADVQIVGEVAAVAPDRAAGARVDRPRVVVEAGCVDDSVHDERRRLEAAERAGLERPLRRQLLDVFGGDLRERAVPLAGVVSRVREPARRILEAVEQILRRHLWRRALGGERDRCGEGDQERAHEALLSGPSNQVRAASSDSR